MLQKTILFTCDHRGCTVGLNTVVKFVSIEAAREAGWAVSRDRMHCYCPSCAPKHRNVGMSYGGCCNWR